MKLMTDAQKRAILKLHELKEIPVAGEHYEEARILERIFDVGTGKQVSYQEAEDCIRYLNRAPKAGTILEQPKPKSGKELHEAGECECHPCGVRCSYYSWQYQTRWGRAENE